ncbi:hypothetical protein ACFT5B_04200 [Luteimicrobium sp. NPDC057192]|uniref:hypothetical protein n=1 Tax=Luteimicrobium sp. NPDC057192 TaxID=3346042 RepID=UPI0036395067
MHRLMPRGRRAAAVAAFAAVAVAGVVVPAGASTAAPQVASSTTLAASTTAKPHLTSQPSSVVVASGQRATFKVRATGLGLTYRWYVSTDGTRWTKIAHATHASHSFVAKPSYNGHRYRVVVRNSHGSATSRAARVTVAVTPHITSQPRSTTVATGKPATFAVRATGNALAYQWYVAAPGKTTYTRVAGATRSTYRFTATAAKSGYRYRVLVHNKAGRVGSTAARLTVVTKPRITKQPIEGQQVASGSRVTLAVKASGIGLHYQWQYVDDSADGDYEYHSIKGATRSSYSFTATTKTHDDYRVVVSNIAGRVGSDDSMVIVDSSLQDPYGPDGMALLTSWLVTLDTEVKGGPTVVTGDNPTTVTSTFLGIPADLHAQTNDLTFALVVGGTTYPATVTAKSLATAGVYDFVATTTVPVPAATARTGVWKVTDASGTKPVSQYLTQR